MIIYYLLYRHFQIKHSVQGGVPSVSYSISSHSPYNGPVQWRLSLRLLYRWDVEAQRGDVICPRSHSSGKSKCVLLPLRCAPTQPLSLTCQEKPMGASEWKLKSFFLSSLVNKWNKLGSLTCLCDLISSVLGKRLP